MPAGYDSSVFLNVPFDPDYAPLLRGIVFCVLDCGFSVRCALEHEDSGEVRFEKLCRLIEACRFAIHDISRTEPDEARLPRFNMPLELGLLLGARRFGNRRQQRKNCLILDRERYRYQRYCSDIAGQDIRAHAGRPEVAISVVRDWLSAAVRRRQRIAPSGSAIVRRNAVFRSRLPHACRKLGHSIETLTFTDYTWFVARWLRENPLK